MNSHNRNLDLRPLFVYIGGTLLTILLVGLAFAYWVFVYKSTTREVPPVPVVPVMTPAPEPETEHGKG